MKFSCSHDPFPAGARRENGPASWLRGQVCPSAQIRMQEGEEVLQNL